MATIKLVNHEFCRVPLVSSYRIYIAYIYIYSIYHNILYILDASVLFEWFLFALRLET